MLSTNRDIVLRVPCLSRARRVVRSCARKMCLRCRGMFRIRVLLPLSNVLTCFPLFLMFSACWKFTACLLLLLLINMLLCQYIPMIVSVCFRFVLTGLEEAGHIFRLRFHPKWKVKPAGCPTQNQQAWSWKGDRNQMNYKTAHINNPTAQNNQMFLCLTFVSHFNAR